MFLYDEIYFEITARGSSEEIDKLECYLSSGELDDFFEISPEYINRDETMDGAEIIFSNDDVGIELDEFEVEDFLDVLCKAGKSVDLRGSLYDTDDNEFTFASPAGDSAYYDSDVPCTFNDELDEAAREEEEEEDEEQ